MARCSPRQPQAAVRIQRDGVLGRAHAGLGWGVWATTFSPRGWGHRRSFFALSTMLIAFHGHQDLQLAGTMWEEHPSPRPCCSDLVHRVFPSAASRRDALGRHPATCSRRTQYFVVAHLHYVFFGGTVWAVVRHLLLVPQITGRLMNEPMARPTSGSRSGHEPDLLPHALLGDAGDSAPHLHLRRQHGFNAMNAVSRWRLHQSPWAR